MIIDPNFTFESPMLGRDVKFDMHNGGVEPHSHDTHQLVYISHGQVSLSNTSESTLLYPGQAAWIPAGMVHEFMAAPAATGKIIYIKNLPGNDIGSGGINIVPSAFVRELMRRICAAGHEWMMDSPEGRLGTVFMDEIKALFSSGRAFSQMPLPLDKRALKIAMILASDPANQDSLENLAKECGAGKRTVERLFISQTGMTFAKWRQMQRIYASLALLMAGESVTNAAASVGYSSISSLVVCVKFCNFETVT